MISSDPSGASCHECDPSMPMFGMEFSIMPWTNMNEQNKLIFAMSPGTLAAWMQKLR